MSRGDDNFETDVLDYPGKKFKDYIYLDEPLKHLERVLHQIVSLPNHKFPAITCLSDAALTLYLIFVFALELENGGMEQFFYNSSGAYAIETVQALKKIGAIQSAALLHANVEALAENYSSNTFRRRENLYALHEQLKSKFTTTTHEYYANVSFNESSGHKECLGALILRYMMSTPDASLTP